jgi:flagellar hook-associated protein 1 FlgK
VALRTISHNIANAEVEGYSRQRAEMSPAGPEYFPFGAIGTGVQVRNVVRLRDGFLDASYRRESSQRQSFELRHGVLSDIEGILGEPSDTGLARTMDAFWNSWSDLANNPASPAAQAVVKQRGQQVAGMFNGFAGRIRDAAARSRIQVDSIVGEVNNLAGQVAELNRQITAAEVSGTQAPDLRDSRDQIADRLAALTGARMEIQANGTAGVYLGSVMLVDATNARTLEARGGLTPTLGLKGDPDPLLGVGGELNALVDVINSDIPNVMSRLDALARGVVNGVNEYHASGWTAAGDALGNANWNPLLGPTGSRVDFFDANFTTASSMKLSSAVQSNAQVIAAGNVQNAPGNADVALAIGALRDEVGMGALAARMGANFGTMIGLPSGASFGDHYAETTSGLGLNVASAEEQFQVFDTLSRMANNRRSEINGVSVDEELTLMLRHQQAYTAASRLVRVADEMAQAVLSMV